MDNIIKTDAEYRELERLAHKLKIPLPPHVIIKLESTVDGKLIDRFEGPSHSYVRNFWNTIFAINAAYTMSGSSFGEGYITTKYLNGTMNNNNAIPCVGAVNNSNQGIVVGTGSGAESFESYDLTTRVVHGSSSGQLSHTLQNTTTIAYTSGTKTWEATLLRIFNNNSGGSIIITEVGILSSAGNLVCRDLLASSVTVANGGQLTVTYTISMVFPA